MPYLPDANDPAVRPNRKWLDKRCRSIGSEVLDKYEQSIVSPEHPWPLAHGILAVLAGGATFVVGCAFAYKHVEKAALLMAFAGVAFLAVVVFVAVMVGLFMVVLWLDTSAHGRWRRGELHPEARAARQAMAVSMAIIDEIRQSPAWRSGLFDEHRARVDLDAARIDIVERANRIDSAAAQLPVIVSTASPEIKAAAAPHTDALCVATDALVGRVRALDEYQKQTKRLATLLEKVERTKQDMKTLSTIESLDPTVFDELYRDAGINDWHAEQVKNDAGEIADLHRAVQFQIQALKELSAVSSLPVLGGRK